MMSVLIVDDEVIIADGISEMVQETFDGRLAVYRTYSAEDAQRIILGMPVDILLTDIDMPVTSGLQLHQWVTFRWPLCKVLFLTGYSDFTYARQALEQHAFAYLLKSDGDQKIVEALERAIAEINAEESKLLADPRLQKARPAYIKECVNQLLHTANITLEQIVQWFNGWDLQISLDRPVFFGIGILNGVECSISDAISAVESLSGERMHCLCTEINPRTIAIMAQTISEPDIMLFSGILEMTQRMLRTERDADLTILYCTDEEKLECLSVAYNRLLRAVERICPNSGEHIGISPDSVPSAQESGALLGLPDVIRQIRECDDYLTTGQEALYFSEMLAVWNQVAASADMEYATMVYHTLLMMIDASMQNYPEARQEYESLRRQGAQLREPKDWRMMKRETDALARQVFVAQRSKTVNRRDALVREVNEYIQGHLSEDLSLIQIAGAVNFHPAYLSRIYKESTHMGLSEYISGQRLAVACKLLRETHNRITDIGSSLGFNSATYFTRFFKKQKGVSPQEYRDRFLT